MHAADSEEAEKLFLKGQYEKCIELCKEAIGERFYREDWVVVLGKTYLMVGKYPEALDLLSNGLTRFRRSLKLRLLGYEVFLQNSERDRAKEILLEINQIAATRQWNSNDAADMVVVGKAALLLGADPRLVLENFFNQAKKLDPKYREVYLALGELALDKNDFDLAAKTFQEALKQFPEDPDMFYGLARAFSGSDRPKMVQNLDAAIAHNSRHIPSLLLLANHLIDAEEYKDANDTLDKVFAINPVSPNAWAYRACIAHVENDLPGESKARESALKYWKTNPNVDHLIGQKLSQKYRFAEGAVYQRRAIQSEHEFLPAKIQLAQDLLRLGEEDLGWRLAEEVNSSDGYDVVAYNLVTLKENIARFQLITNRDFVVRMDTREAALYGRRVLELLQRAKDKLCEKYGLKLEASTLVEIFPEQKDFAVRTFGMPGGEGYLGVCFGRVITANSPAAQSAHPANWQAVLWHEFCHVVTLALTKNKMPRWLSEGISVYEERQANPAWGQAMNPRYREMILKGELTPIGELSSAFLTPKTGLHLQFAYYESSLAVEFLIQRFGAEALRRILVDLGEGISINKAIEKQTAALGKIEPDFKAFVLQRAEQLGPGLDWKEIPPRELTEPAERLLADHPNNYWALMRASRKLLSEKKWEESKAPLRLVLERFPDQTGADNAYLLLASAHRGLNETEPERQTLSKLAVQDSSALDAYLRLMELNTEKGEWPAVTANAERYLAVNPLVAAPHRFLGRASEALGKTEQAIGAYENLLRFEPADLAEVHYRLAKLQHPSNIAAAKRHVLQALEEAPRYLDAHRLLLGIVTDESRAAKPAENSTGKNVPAASGLEAPKP